MMQGDAPCMHVDGEFCDKCYPATMNFCESYELQKQINQKLFLRVAKLEKTLNEMFDKIAEMANWCYREK